MAHSRGHPSPFYVPRKARHVHTNDETARPLNKQIRFLFWGQLYIYWLLFYTYFHLFFPRDDWLIHTFLRLDSTMYLKLFHEDYNKLKVLGSVRVKMNKVKENTLTLSKWSNMKHDHFHKWLFIIDRQLQECWCERGRRFTSPRDNGFPDGSGCTVVPLVARQTQTAIHVIRIVHYLRNI